MFTPINILVAIIVILVVALGGLYLVGAQIGRRRARELIQLAVELMRPIGKDGSFQWLGSTGCEIRLADVQPPFRGVRVVVWLEPRELFPLWLVNRLRGRRDLIGVAADLVNPPTTTFELVDPASAAGRRALVKARERGWAEGPWTFANRSLVLAAPDLPDARKVLTRLSAPGAVERMNVSRLGVSVDSPQLSVTISGLGALREAGSGFVQWLTRVAATVADGRGPARASDRPRPSKLPRSRRSGR